MEAYIFGKYLSAHAVEAVEPGLVQTPPRHENSMADEDISMLRIQPVCVVLSDTYKYRINTETSDCMNAIERETKKCHPRLML